MAINIAHLKDEASHAKASVVSHDTADIYSPGNNLRGVYFTRQIPFLGNTTRYI